MEAKFTKGPWTINAGDLQHDCSITSQERKGMVGICNVDGAYFDDNPISEFEGQQKANAHLIAASPKLYEELERLDPENEALKLARGEQ